MEIKYLGLQKYSQALEIMTHMHNKIATDNNSTGCILVVEHPAVITMGKRYLPGDMLVTEEQLTTVGVDFAHIDRGGSVTVHEVGQAVVYPLVRLSGNTLTPKHLVWVLEQAMINVALSYGVTSARDSINAGIWVEQNKLGAIGMRIKDHVSKHGLAFNVCNNLNTFNYIIPCGLTNRGVTTLAKEILAQKSASKVPNVQTVGIQIAEQIKLQLTK